MEPKEKTDNVGPEPTLKSSLEKVEDKMVYLMDYSINIVKQANELFNGITNPDRAEPKCEEGQAERSNEGNRIGLLLHKIQDVEENMQSIEAVMRALKEVIG